MENQYLQKHDHHVVHTIATLVKKYGSFKILHSNNGTEFAATEVEEFYKINEIGVWICVGWRVVMFVWLVVRYPQSQDAVEILNKTIKKALMAV